LLDKFIKRYEIKTLMLNKKHRAVFAGAGAAQTEYLRHMKAVPRFEIPCGVDTEIMPLPLMKKKLGINDNTVMYLIKPHGDFDKVKVVADALNDIGEFSGPDTVLAVVGAAPKRNEFDKRKVVFTGEISLEEDIAYKYGCDVYVHFAKGDSLHVDLLEAGLFGKASVSITDGAFPVIENNYDGIISSLDDESLKAALQKLRLHKKLRSELGENFKRKVELKYNWQQSALALIDAVWELNGARRHG
jgi:glycosyltransferase involved in cell wall biosynthesis